jgi:pinin
MEVDGAENNNNEEGTKDVDVEGHEPSSGVTEGSDRRGFNNGGFRRDGNLRMQRRVVSTD